MPDQASLDPATAPAAPTPAATFRPEVGAAEPVGSPVTRVPLPVKIAAGSGEACINIGVNIPKNLLFTVYNIVLGVSPTLLGIALFIPRLWDAVLDPLMGSISDNARNRFGRRRPFMLVGGLLTAVLIGLLCVFPRPAWVIGFVGDANASLLGFTASFGWDEVFYASWLMVVSMLFYAALTVFAVPYGALTMEMTGDYAERTRVMSFRTLFTYLSGLLMGWMYPFIRGVDWAFLQDPVTGELDPIKSTWVVGAFLVALILVCSLLPTLFVREPTRTAASNAAPKINVIDGLKESLRSRAFLLIIGAYTIGFLGVIMVIGLGQYVCFYHVYGGDQETGSFVQGWAQTFAVAMGILTTFLINRLAGVFEKKTLLLGALASAFLGGLLSWWLYDPGFATRELRFFVNDEGSAWLNISFHPLVISYSLIWPGLAGLLIMSNSMIADLCDVDELKTGQRREGMYWAVFNWIQKTAISVALLFSGVILSVVGFDADQKTQTPETLWQMRFAYALVVCGGVAVAAGLVVLIPLSRERMEAVRAELSERADVLGRGSVRG